MWKFYVQTCKFVKKGMKNLPRDENLTVKVKDLLSVACYIG